MLAGGVSLTSGLKSSLSCSIVFSHHITAEIIIIVYISSPSCGMEAFVTAKPVATKPSVCVPLERHAIKCDRRIGNDITPRFRGHRSPAPDRLLMRITTISCLPPTGKCFFFVVVVGGGVSATRSVCDGGIDKEHLFSLLKTKQWGSVEDFSVFFLLFRLYCPHPLSCE